MTLTESSEARVRLAVQTLRRTARVPLSFGGVVTAGTLRIDSLSGASTLMLAGLAVHAGAGLGGRAVITRRPALVDRYLLSSGISHEFDHIIAAEDIRSLVAVPVVVRRRVRAVIYAGTRGDRTLGERAFGSALDLARDLEQDIVLAEESVPTDRPRSLPQELRVCVDGPLSVRELDVLTLVSLGSTNAEVATELRLSPETVKSYLRSAMRKLGSRTRLQAVSTARRAGLLPDDQ
ncbi:response regulator transcription factor [Nocardia xishanensis]|uniref:response regulator transcription factor n=1 Tax=Nocardia xishanensis TaxID=238964 RepID=UPI003404CFFE